MAIKRANRTLLTGLLAVAQLALASSVALMPAASAQDAKARPHIDLAFCIDTTGSMQSEIDNVKAKTKEIVAKLAGGKPSPLIRVGLVAYRDRGDEYVTKVFPFTEDIDKMVKDISGLQANGGGDTPEAVNEALHSSVHDLAWSSDKKTLKLLFLIGDAGPKHYPNDYDWHAEAKQAIANGIEINTLGCQGLETSMPTVEGVDVFKEIAHLADGKYEPLSYRHEIAEAGGKRATIVSSGGSLYKVAGGAGADWHAGAEKLAAEGRAVRMDARAFTGGIMVDTAAAAPAMAGTRAYTMSSLKAKSSPAAMAASAPVGSYAMTSRDENNLADLVLQATKDAAKKQLKVDFKEK
ncbi:MAG TPA: vWA domain-containing protein [Candidatus Obscuribacterales bacterium]